MPVYETLELCCIVYLLLYCVSCLIVLLIHDTLHHTIFPLATGSLEMVIYEILPSYYEIIADVIQMCE